MYHAMPAWKSGSASVITENCWQAVHCSGDAGNVIITWFSNPSIDHSSVRSLTLAGDDDRRTKSRPLFFVLQPRNSSMSCPHRQEYCSASFAGVSALRCSYRETPRSSHVDLHWWDFWHHFPLPPCSSFQLSPLSHGKYRLGMSHRVCIDRIEHFRRIGVVHTHKSFPNDSRHRTELRHCWRNPTNTVQTPNRLHIDLAGEDSRKGIGIWSLSKRLYQSWEVSVLPKK